MIEVSRNQSLKGSQRPDLANAGLAELSQRVSMQTGTAPDLSVAKAAGFDEREGAGDMVVDCAHGSDRAHSNGLRNPKAHYNGFAKRLYAHYEVHMPFHPDRTRAAIQTAADRLKLTPTGWAREAKIGRNTLRAFLSGQNNGIELRTICLLADYAKVHPYDLMGIDPPGELALEAAAMENIERSLERISSTNAGTSFDMQTVRSLMRAAVRARTSDTPDSPPAPPPEKPTRPKRSQ